MQHRVANSLQIIASILMQSARKVQSSEARGHLSDAHQRVMSIATLQRHLAESEGGRSNSTLSGAAVCQHRRVDDL
jgi:two-component sensor histidine kinase